MTPKPGDFSRDPVKDALDAVRADDAATVVPARVQRRIMQEWDAHSAPRSRRWMTPARIGAVAAGIIAAIVWARPDVDSSRGGHDTAASETVAADRFFTEVALDADPASLQYVQVRMPQSALADVGLPIADPADHQTVVVEMLVGLDGAPRALRLLSKEMR